MFLSSPGQNARGLTKCFNDVVGLDKNIVSRTTMDKVRGAWVEFYKTMVMKLPAKRVAADVAFANNTRAVFVALFLIHVQDEADIRFRNGADDDVNIPAGVGRPRCSNTSSSLPPNMVPWKSRRRWRPSVNKLLRRCAPTSSGLFVPSLPTCFQPQVSVPNHRRRCQPSHRRRCQPSHRRTYGCSIFWSRLHRHQGCNRQTRVGLPK